MNIKSNDRDYTLSDADLIMFASGLVGFMTRDITEFGNFSITALDVTALGVKEDEFEAFPTDNELKADMMIAVEDKELAREELMVAMREVSDKALIKWGDNSARYVRFGVKGLARISDRQLNTASRNVIRTGTMYLNLLLSEGLSQIMLDALTVLADDYETKFDALTDAIAERDIAREDRIELGNELYDLVAKYCEIGKVLWKETSEARYNDYVVYKSVHSGLSKPQNLTAVEDPTDPMKVEINFDVVAGATEYRLYKSETEIGHTSGDFTQISVSATNYFDAPLIPGKRNYWKVRAYSADKKSDYSDEVYIDS